MNDRGMKKWAPFQSLKEQSIFLEQMKEKKSRIEMPLISNDQAEKIDYILKNHQDKELRFVYFNNGHLYEIIQKVIDIDLTTHIIKGSEMKIKLTDIIDVDEL